jgi:hypothetical protein
MHTRARFQEGDAPRSPFYECFAHPLLRCAVDTEEAAAFGALEVGRFDADAFDGSFALARDVPLSI